MELFRFGVVEKLDRPRPMIANGPPELDRRRLHLEADLLRHDNGGPLLDDLLVAPLDGAVAREEGGDISLEIAEDLDFDMAATIRGLFHDEEPRSGRFPHNLRVDRTELARVFRLAHPPPPAGPGGLDHHRPADRLRLRNRLFNASDSRFVVQVFRNPIADLAGINAENLVITPRHFSTPVKDRDADRLRDDHRGDLVSERLHRALRRAHEDDPRLRQRLREGVILGGVPPPRPDGIDPLLRRDFDDLSDILVVVVIRASGDLDHPVSEADEFGVGVDVFRGRHRHDLNRPFIAKILVGPLADPEGPFDRRHPVVRDQDLVDASYCDTAVTGHMGLHVGRDNNRELSRDAGGPSCREGAGHFGQCGTG